MIIELISVGDELLKGSVLNTNVTFLSRYLQERGYDVARHITLKDEPLSLKEGLRESFQRADITIVTGGLGPTLDDRTKQVVADLFHSPFHFEEKIAADLQRRFGKAPLWLHDQSSIPTKAQYFLNPIGTAPALLFSEKGKTLILLPGVPIEMQALFQEKIFPFLAKEFPVEEVKETLQLFFILVHESMIDPYLRELEQKHPGVEVGIYPGWGNLSVVLRSRKSQALHAFAEGLQQKFSPYLFSAPHGKIEEALQEWFVKNKQTLACAESCTGGTIASHITSLSGASDYFLGSFVTYSNQMKSDLLGVSEHTLKRHSAVSSETVQEMLAGVFKNSRADFAIAVSGIAGPSGGTPEKPVGTIFAAIGKRGEPPDSGHFLAKGSRQTIILSTTHFLLGSLYRKVTQGIPAFPLII